MSNRTISILAFLCTLAALVFATFAGVHASRRPSASANSRAAAKFPAPIFLKSKNLGDSPNPAATAASESKPVHTSEPINSANANAAASAPDRDPQDQDDGPGVLRFASNPEPLPLFMAQDINGQVVSSAAYKGKVVFVNFWATWCPPCREEIPDLIKLQDTYKDQFQIISISEDDAPPEAMREFAKQAHINYPIILLNTEINRDFGGIPALPTSFVINRDGGIVQKHVGLYSPELFEAEIRTLSDMPGSLKVETFKDEGQIFLKNAANATDLPGVDFSGLTEDQRSAALHKMNAEGCTCGCKLTLAQCRINDTACGVSRSICAKIVEAIAKKKADSPDSPKPTSSAPGSTD